MKFNRTGSEGEWTKMLSTTGQWPDGLISIPLLGESAIL